jgi:hypothetical protein
MKTETKEERAARIARIREANRIAGRKPIQIRLTAPQKRIP